MIIIKLIQIKKRKDQINQKKIIKEKNKKKNIKKEFKYVKEEYKLLITLKDNINNQQKTAINVTKLHQHQFKYLLNLLNISMVYVKTNVHIVKNKIK